MDEYSQLYFVKIGLPIALLGYLAAAGNGVIALAGKLSYTLSRFKRQHVFTAAIVVSAVGFFIVGATQSWVGVLFTFLPWMAYYAISPLILSDLHRELPSGQRATGESFMSLAKEIFLIPIAFTFSYFADQVSIFAAYTAIGGVVTLYLMAYLVKSYRKIPPGGLVVVEEV